MHLMAAAQLHANGVRWVASSAYCTNVTGVDNHSSFGYSLVSCAAAVTKSSRCAPFRAASGGLFYYAEGYNGQCTCARDSCTKRNRMAMSSVYKLAPRMPAAGADVVVDFADLTQSGLLGKESVAASYDVYSFWEGMSLGTFTGSYTAKELPMHGTAFLRLTKSESK